MANQLVEVKDFPVMEHALPNGLRIRLLPDRSLPVATLYSFFRVGSRNERPGITGISHLAVVVPGLGPASSLERRQRCA